MLEFLLANLPILLCVLSGLALLTVELFLPGFGVPGFSGIALLLVSVALLWISGGPLAGLGLLVVIVVLVALVISLTLRSAASGKLSRSPIILEDAERAEDGYIASSDMRVFLGKEGTVKTVLRPSGIADFDGVRLNVVSDATFVRPGTRVRIARVEGSRIVVTEV